MMMMVMMMAMSFVMLARLRTLIVELHGTKLYVMSQWKRNDCRSPSILSWAAQLRTSAPSSQCPVERMRFCIAQVPFELW